MFNLRTVKDQEAYDKTRKAFIKLLIYAKLTGLTLFGESILIEENSSIDTMATDGKRLYYSPAWVLKKSEDSVMFDGLHEWLHIFGNHVGRRGTRDKKRWGFAADVRVAWDGRNIMQATRPAWQLDADHIPPLDWAKNLTVEQIYDRLKPEDMPKEAKPDLLDGPPVGASPEEGPVEERDEHFKQKFAESLAQAVAALEMTNVDIKKMYGETIHERLIEIMRGTVPWGRLLNSRLCTDLGKETMSWYPPNRRYFPELILPSLRSKKEKSLLIAFDLSGSVASNKDLLSKFASEITPAAQRAQRTTILTFDAVIREEITTRDPRAILRDLKFSTGAHSYTSVRPVFDWVDKHKPTSVAILTDGLIELPDSSYPATHWVLPRGGREQPWGHNYIMELAW